MAPVTKVLSTILSGPIGLIDKRLGQQISGIGLTVIGVITGNPVALAAGSFQLQQGFAPPAPKPEQTETSIRSPIPPRISGYGVQRLQMAYALYITAPTSEGIDVGVFHEGRVNAIRGAYLGDKKIVYNSTGWVQRGEGQEFGKNSDRVRIGFRLGAETETAFSEVIALVPDRWTTNHRGDGCVTGFAIWKSVKASAFQDDYPSGGPNNMPLSLVMELQPVFDWRDPSQSVTDPLTWKWKENTILHLAHYLLVRDNKTWAKHFAPTLAYWTAAANDADVAMPLKGVQTVLASAAKKGNGFVDVQSANGLAPGMVITISATGNTSLTETRTVTSVSSVVGNGVMTVAFSGGGLAYDHPVGSSVSYVSSASAPATEPRYRSCVVHKHTDEHKSVVAALLACCDGWMTPRADGALVVYSGRYYEPTVTLTDADIINLSVQDGVEEENSVNQIPLTYVSANHDYNTVDTDAWTDEEDVERRGKILASSGLANQVPSHSQARRLGKRAYAEANAFPRGSATLRGSKNARKLIGERYVRIRSASAVIDQIVQVKAPVKRDPLTGRITFNFLAADPSVDFWNPATEEGDPAPVGNRVAVDPVEQPVITSATVNFSADSGGGAPGAFIHLVIAAPARDDLTWSARTRIVGASVWGERNYTDIDPSASVTIDTEFVPTDKQVEVQVQYQVGDGRNSPWSDSKIVNTSTAAVETDYDGGNASGT